MIFSLLRNDKNKRSNAYNSGIYKISVQNIEDNYLEVYVEATARNFKNRLAEHKDNLCKGNLVAALAQRAYEKDVNVLWQNVKVIKNICNRRDLPIKEKIEILKSNKTEKIINLRQTNEICMAWKYAVKKLV